MKKFAVGESDFKEVISGNYYYVDKSLFIKDIIDRGNKIILIPRPPPSSATNQPGTVNSYQKLFESLAIMEAGREYTDKLGQYPVIFLTFKDIKEPDWDTCFYKIKQLVQKEYLRFSKKFFKQPWPMRFQIEFFQESQPRPFFIFEIFRVL
ncbi:MAG: hypothetical protein QG657_1440 [Acidobacteriota bacterium]|nr:hypothetical protein [Acidobacteriota bacterium]